jgi:hypothetical protein
VIFIIVQNDVAGQMKDTRKSKYKENFIKFGFTSIVINGDERLQCMISCEVLANEPFKTN